MAFPPSTLDTVGLPGATHYGHGLCCCRAGEHALGDAHMDLESGHQLIQRLKKKGRTESVARPRLMAGKRASKAWGAGASGHGGATPPLKVSHATMPDWREGAQRRLANTHPRARACRS